MLGRAMMEASKANVSLADSLNKLGNDSARVKNIRERLKAELKTAEAGYESAAYNGSYEGQSESRMRIDFCKELLAIVGE